jgi:hypothetical protein
MISELQLSHSSRKLMHSCARRLEFYKFYAASLRDKSVAGNAGTAMHIAMQHYIEHHDKQEAIWQLMQNYPIQWGNNPSSTGWSLEACYSALDLVMASSHLDRYELAYVQLSNGEKRAAIEVPFRINLPGYKLANKIAVNYVGYIDLILYDPLTDTHIIMDYKNTTRNIADAAVLYQFDEQLLPYSFVLEHILKKPIRNLTTLYYHIDVSLQEPRAQLLEFNHSEQDIQDWLRGFVLDLKVLDTYCEMQWFPRNSNACYNYNRKCLYFEACASRDPTYIEYWLSMQNANAYKANPFDPWFELDIELDMDIQSHRVTIGDSINGTTR